MYEPDSVNANPVKTGTMTTDKAAAIVVVASLVALIAINRGFRGVSVGGIKVGVS